MKKKTDNPNYYDFDFISRNGIWVRYYHKNLVNMINSITEKEKSQLEKFCGQVRKMLGSELEIEWCDKDYKINHSDSDKLKMENVLRYIDLGGIRQALHIAPDDYGDIFKGLLQYQHHNLDEHDDWKRTKTGAAITVLTQYINLLNKQAVKLNNLKESERAMKKHMKEIDKLSL